jgi:hypothetical protein
MCIRAVRRILIKSSQMSARLLRNCVEVSSCAVAARCVTAFCKQMTIKLRANLSGHRPDRHGHRMHGDGVKTKLKGRKRSYKKHTPCGMPDLSQPYTDTGVIYAIDGIYLVYTVYLKVHILYVPTLTICLPASSSYAMGHHRHGPIVHCVWQFWCSRCSQVQRTSFVDCFFLVSGPMQTWSGRLCLGPCLHLHAASHIC